MPASWAVRWPTLGFFLLGVAGAAGADRERPPVPELNAKVVEFARSHLGEPVGDGICITLAVEALRAAGAKRWPLGDPAGEYRWGEPVADLKDVLPGDILQFRDATFAGSRHAGKNRRVTWRDSYPHHTAIVAANAENGRLITIYHQNVQGPDVDPARVGHVREAILRMNSMQPGGQVHAFRPVPAPAEGREGRFAPGR